jgi:hypothetical protein
MDPLAAQFHTNIVSSNHMDIYHLFLNRPLSHLYANETDGYISEEIIFQVTAKYMMRKQPSFNYQNRKSTLTGM